MKSQFDVEAKPVFHSKSTGDLAEAIRQNIEMMPKTASLTLGFKLTDASAITKFPL